MGSAYGRFLGQVEELGINSAANRELLMGFRQGCDTIRIGVLERSRDDKVGDLGEVKSLERRHCGQKPFFSGVGAEPPWGKA